MTLQDIPPGGPRSVSFIGVTLFLTEIAILASYLPTRCATNVDPIIVLRNE